jgi:hypothetical protein
MIDELTTTAPRCRWPRGFKRIGLGALSRKNTVQLFVIDHIKPPTVDQ